MILLSLDSFCRRYAGGLQRFNSGKYDLEPGDASTIDIFAPRSIRDKAETDLRAAQAAAST